MTRLALTGGAYEAHSVIAAAQRSVNLFSEPIPENLGEPAKAVDFPTPGLRLLGTIGTGPVRAIRQATNGTVYVVSGHQVYSVNTTSWVGTSLGSITVGLRAPVSMCDNTLELVIVDGSANGWKITLADNVFAPLVQNDTITAAIATGTEPIQKDIARYTKFIPTFDSTIMSVTVSLATGNAGKMKCAIFDADGMELTTADERTSPNTGDNTFNFHDPIAVTRGTTYWIGFCCDTGVGAWNIGTSTPGQYSNTVYADFPVNAPAHTFASAVICTMRMASDPGAAFVGADRVDYLDTFFIFNKPKTPQFYWTLPLSTVFDPLALDYANKSAYTDLLATLIVAKREIWLLGEQTSEIWYDVGATDTGAQSSQFAPVQSVFIDHGCAAKYSVANYDNGVFWLTRDRQGHGFVVMGSGYATKRVSTFAIEAEFAAYSRIDDAIGYCYQLAGHTFYVITFPHADHTWVYDITTGLWHEWVWIDTNGEEHRHRSNCFWPVDGNTLVVGDWQNGNLYALDNAVFTDNGQPIKRVRSFPHMVNDGKRVFYRQFLADIDTGTSSATAPVAPSAPTTTTLLQASFTAPDDTWLEDYTSDAGGGWLIIPGLDSAWIQSNQLTGSGGDALYESATTLASADYTVRFNTIPSAYDNVPSYASQGIFARATSGEQYTGYRASVDADGTQYTLTLNTEGADDPSVSLPMGTLTSGIYTVWLVLKGTTIAAQCQRTQDGMWLHPGGTWAAGGPVTALQFTDATYTAAGVIMVGGYWD